MLLDDPELLAKMKMNSIEFARTRTWESVFETVYEAYYEAKEYMDRIRIEQPDRKKRVFKFLRKTPATRS
jgi:hypothetical protein